MIVFHLSDIFSFSVKYSTISFTNHNPKNKHNGQDKKFIATAIVSGDSHPPENIDQILNQKVINMYHRYGIAQAVQTFHHKRPWFSAITFGVYMYAWFASQAVEYGIKDNWNPYK